MQILDVDTSKGNVLKAKIACPSCGKKVASLLRTNDSGVANWNISNYVRHVEVHTAAESATVSRTRKGKRSTRSTQHKTQIKKEVNTEDRSPETASLLQVEENSEEIGYEVKRGKVDTVSSLSQDNKENVEDCK